MHSGEDSSEAPGEQFSSEKRDGSSDAEIGPTSTNNAISAGGSTERIIAGLVLPQWVSGTLEASLRKCERGFDAAWHLSESGDDLANAMYEAERTIHEMEVLSRMNMSKEEMQELLINTLHSLKLLRRALPELDQLEMWMSDMDEARTALRGYLVQRNLFKLKLTDEMR